MLLAIKDKLLLTMARYPSVHNVQPFSVKFEESKIIVYDDPDRTLKVGDPEERDHEISLGAFIEGISLSLSMFGLRTKNLLIVNESNGKERIRARIDVESGGKEDELSSYLLKRRCFRGKFKALSDDEKILERNKLQALANVHILSGSVADWARAYDESSYFFSSQPQHMKELYSWLRLTKDHPRYDLDGLNAEALYLNHGEGFFGNLLLNPSTYQWMKKFGLGKILISEAPQINSSLAVVAITAPEESDLIAMGRLLMRTWLELTRLEIFVTPLSALADEPQSRKRIEEELTEKRKLVTIFRVGKVNGIKPYESPRRVLEKF